MATTITAVFEDGVLKPTSRLKLRPNERVKLQIVRESPLAEPTLGPLAGAFPVLGAVEWKDVAAAKRIWNRGLQKQLRSVGRKGT